MNKYIKYLNNKKKISNDSLSSIYKFNIIDKSYFLKEEYKLFYKNEHIILKKMKHNNIIKIIDYIENENKIFLILDYFNGDKLRYSKLDNNEMITIFIEILKTIKYIHQQHIIHFDISSDNILYKDKQIKIIDFGNSIDLDKESNEYKLENMFGRWQNISPETFNTSKIGYFNDIWALGILLYNIKYKREPFYKKGFDIDKIYFNIKYKKINNIIRYILTNYLDLNIDKIINFIFEN